MANETNNGFGAPQFRDANKPASARPVNHPINAAYPTGQPVPAHGNAPVHMGAGNQPGGTNAKPPKKRAPLIIAIIIAVIVLIVGLCLWFFLGGGNNFFDSRAQQGQAPYKTQEEIQAELDRVVEEGMLNLSIASVIEFENGTSEGAAYIENVPSNRYVLRVSITLDSTGEQVYQSGGLRPDSYIEYITLSEDLAAGTYPATATFVAYNPDTLQEVGQAAAKITIVVDS